MERVEIEPVTAATWPLFAELFERHGILRGCWCMYFRVTSRQFEGDWGDGNRRGMQQLVHQEGRVPGLLAVAEQRAVGWVSVAPKEEFGRLQRSPVAKTDDGVQLWSVVCFYVEREWRGSGLQRRLLEAACQLAAAQGAEWVEAYPVDTGDHKAAAAELYYGVLSTFLDAGFTEVERRSPRRLIVRKRVG